MASAAGLEGRQMHRRSRHGPEANDCILAVADWMKSQLECDDQIAMCTGSKDLAGLMSQVGLVSRTGMMTGPRTRRDWDVLLGSMTNDDDAAAEIRTEASIAYTPAIAVLHFSSGRGASQGQERFAVWHSMQLVQRPGNQVPRKTNDARICS